MTTTTLDAPAAETTTPSATPAPFIPPPAARAPLPARLLSSDADDRQGNVLRLGLGFAGLSALALLPELARSLVDKASTEFGVLDWPLVLVLDALSLPVAAVLTLTFALPGLLILLGVFGQPLVPAALFQAVSRAYYRVGLLALGATPALLLFALTGGSDGLVSAGVAVTYLGAGLVSLALLLSDLIGSAEKQRGFAPLIVLGWAAFVALFGLHLFTRLNVQWL